MPVTKRHLYDSQLYGPPDLYEESPPENLLEDIAMSQTLGALHQLRYLAMYSVEIFDNLIRLSVDLSDRIQMVNIKANLIVSKLPAIEKKVRSTDLVQIPKKKKMKKFRSRDPYMPSILTKNTNCSQIKSQYTFCNIMPQLWKMETIVPEDCVIKYSHPGFFFEEWLKVEILKQDELRKEKKKAKEERRKIREEKRKKRREEEEKQGPLLTARDRAKARARQLKEEKRKEKERMAREAEENRRRIAGSRPTITPGTLEHLVTSSEAVLSKPTTQPPIPQEVKPRYPPEFIAVQSMPEPPRPPDSRNHLSPPPNSAKPRRSDPSLKEPPQERKSSERNSLERKPLESLPRSRAPSGNDNLPFEDLDPPPPDDDLPPPEDDLPPPDDDLPPPDDDLPPPDDDALPPLDDDPPPPLAMDELPPPSDDLEPPPDSPPSPLARESASILSPPPQPSRPPSPPQVKAAPEHSPPSQAVPLPPKPVPKAARRKSLLDIKVDKKAVLAAATENLKNLNQRVDRDERERESEEFGDHDFIRDSIQSFSKPFSRVSEAEDESEDKEESGRDSPPAIEYSLPPRRASIRMSSVPPPAPGGGRRQSLSQATPLSAAELKRGARHSSIQPFGEHATDEEHALYAAASARAAQESVEAMTSLYHDDEYPPPPDEWQGYGNGEGYAEGVPQHQHQQDYGEGDYGADENGYYNSGYGYEQYDQEEQGQWNAEEAPEELPDDLPPMEEQPVHTRQQSSLALFSGGSILADIQSGRTLRKAAPPPPKERSARETSLDLIKSGGVQLRRAEPMATKAPEQRSGAIAAILSNRAQIAGSDSDSDSSDSDFSDDDLF